jgi:hypothetical protein
MEVRRKIGNVLGVNRKRTSRARLKARLLGEITIEVVLDGTEKIEHRTRKKRSSSSSYFLMPP